MSTLFVEPVGGVAGDMLLAALLDLEDPRFGLADLRALGAALVPGELDLTAREVRRGGFRALLLEVRTPESARPPHRRLADLEGLVADAPLGAGARERARRTFQRIAEAEARVHGIPIGEIHFHEVGAVDAVIDVCGVALALERLEIERVHATAPPTGDGTVRCAHGTVPVPAPGTAEILRGLPAILGGGPGERTTPTGAALLAELVDRFEPPGAGRVTAIGYGAGQRDPEGGPANLLRAQLVDPGVGAARGEAWLLEVNLDDARGEAVGFLVEELRRAGALEAWSAPCQMKKDRPGVIVSALCRAERREALERATFRHSPTFGLRWSRRERTECGRREVRVSLGEHRVRVKVRLRPGVARPDRTDLAPEHDDAAAAARALELPLEELRQRAIEAARVLLDEESAQGPAASARSAGS